MAPGWVLDAFAGLMMAVAAVSAARLASARPWQRGAVINDTDVSHVLMAIAMAGMLVTTLTTLPSRAWEGIFGVLTIWFGYRVVRDARANGARALAGGHCAPHLVHSAAMLYMFLAVGTAAGAGMSGMGGAAVTQTLSYPTLALVFAFVLAGYTVWDLDQLSGRRHAFSVAGPAVAGVPAMAGAAALAGPAPSQELREAALSSAMTVGCRIAMGVTMAFMLLIMI
jgi:hypothetical protein